ncbi:hypothetical protein AA0616_2406 [Komagataeibacter nataicola NRIC 0616]|nr:hypothetical protein AA0616_2406 [Komagataeibacter nataicola NRIC 0616]
MGNIPPDLMTLQDVLERLKGKIGRCRLLGHIRECPEHNGGPTHRRWGRKYIFSQSDYHRLIESIECPSRSYPSRNRKISTCGALSPDKAYSKALERLTNGLQKKSGASVKLNSGMKQSMANGRS